MYHSSFLDIFIFLLLIETNYLSYCQGKYVLLKLLTYLLISKKFVLIVQITKVERTDLNKVYIRWNSPPSRYRVFVRNLDINPNIEMEWPCL